MDIMAKARLGNDPQRVQTKTGTEMARGFAFLDIEGESGLPAGLVGFNRIAGALLKYRKGDAIRITGTLKENRWEKDGEEQVGYQVVVDSLMGVKAAKTQYQERKPKAEQQQRNKATQEFYDDALPEF